MPPILNELRVVIVADDPLARAGLAALLSDQPGIIVAGQMSSDDARSDIAAFHSPDAIVWDLGWTPGLSLEAVADFGEAAPPIVALLPDVSHASAALAAGARGLLPRSIPAEALAATLIAVAQGLTVIGPELADAVRPAGRPPATPLADELTPREREVLLLVAEGLPNKSIAGRLGISEHTVKFHVNAIMGKIGAQSRTEAVTRATHLGLIPL